jgi:hypothetical protein
MLVGKTPFGKTPFGIATFGKNNVWSKQCLVEKPSYFARTLI